MKTEAHSLRPFIGSKDFAQSRAFYTAWSFQETVLTPKLSVFTTGTLRFYLQDAYNQDWVDNTMLFLEVAGVSRYWQELQALNLPASYAGVKVSAVQAVEWGKVCYVHDPAGILWHIGEFAA